MMSCCMRVTSRPLKQFFLPVMLVVASVANADNRDPDRDAIYGLVDRLVACWERAAHRVFQSFGKPTVTSLFPMEVC